MTYHFKKLMNDYFETEVTVEIVVKCSKLMQSVPTCLPPFLFIFKFIGLETNLERIWKLM